jgi:mannosyltransferase OCH1-like enzyme/Tfp pilus assembly protein PilF
MPDDQRQPADLPRRLQQADDLRARGDVAAAEAVLQEILAQAPAYVPAFISLAVCARSRGDRAGASHWFGQAAAAEPANPRWQIEAATEQYESGQTAAALAALEQILAGAPGDLATLMALAYCTRRLGDHAASLRWYQASAEVDPANIAVRLAIAGNLQALGELAQAEPAFLQILMAEPGNLEALQGAAVCARLQGGAARAVPHAREAVALDPANPRRRLDLAETLREAGRIAEAEAALQELLAQAPTHVPAFVALAVCARQRNDRAAALGWFRAAAAVEPGNPDFAAEIAGEQAELGQLDAAEAGLRDLLAAAPGSPRALLGLAFCAQKRGGHAAALRWYREAAAIEPENLNIRLAIAAALAELGELATAELEFRTVLNATAGNVQALQGLATCAVKRGAPRTAVSLLREAVDLAPADFWLPIALAAQLRELGQLDDAEEIYCRLLAASPEQSPNQAHAHIGLGQLARLRGGRPAALAHFTAAAAASPGDLSAGLEIAAEQREAGALDAARQTIAAVLALHPNNLHALMGLGQTERHAYRDDAALAAFQAAHDAWPAHSEPLVEMAVQLRLLGRQAECDRRLEQALALNPRSVSALARQADQTMMTGDLPASYALSLRAIEIEPSSITAYLAAAECLARMAKMDEALALLAALRETRGPQSAIILKQLGLLRQAGDNIGALALARQAAQDAPHDFQLAVERFHCEILGGSDAEVAACLAGLLPGVTHQRASAARLHGILAENEFRFADAIHHYNVAIAHNASDPGMQEDLVRCHLMRFDLASARRHLRRYFEQTAYITRLQNKSQNISQSLYGQIIDEFWLDAALTDELQTLQAQPAATRIAPIAAQVLANPDSTAAAIGLMIALRQHGAFARQVHPANNSIPIPKVIVQFWDSADMPDDVAALMQSWRSHNPQLTHRLFSDATARAYLREFFPPAVLGAYHRGDGPAQKSDIFRLAYFAREGGIYADADDRCLAPLDGIIDPYAELVLYQENICSAGNNFFAVRPRHPVLVAALRLAIDAINRGDTDNVWLATGPGLLTRALAGQLAQSWQSKAALPPGVTVLSRRELTRVVAANCILGYKFSHRHWLNAAFAKRRAAAATATG